jgi:hypothetical protein
MKTASSFTNTNGDGFQSARIREEDYVPESASLMHVKLDDPRKKAEQLAEKMRKSKRKEIQSTTRGFLYGNVTPRERSVSPMFTSLQVRKFPAIDFSLAGQAKR